MAHVLQLGALSHTNCEGSSPTTIKIENQLEAVIVKRAEPG